MGVLVCLKNKIRRHQSCQEKATRRKPDDNQKRGF